MKIETAGKSISETLTTLVKTSLPNTLTSGLGRHLRGQIRTDPKSKGKAIIFKWNNGTFRVTENLTVTEQNFLNDWIKSEESVKVEAVLRAHVVDQPPMPVEVEQEKMPTAAKTEVAA